MGDEWEGRRYGNGGDIVSLENGIRNGEGRKEVSVGRSNSFIGCGKNGSWVRGGGGGGVFKRGGKRPKREKMEVSSVRAASASQAGEERDKKRFH